MHYPFIFPLALSRAYAHLERMQILDKKVVFRCKIDVFVNNMSDRYRLGECNVFVVNICCGCSFLLCIIECNVDVVAL